MTTLERIAAEIVAGLLLIGGVLLWWNLHNRHEQLVGAQACIQTTTVDKQTAAAGVAKTEAAQAVDIDTVVKAYDAKLADLSARNDDLAGRLLASGAIRPSGVSHPGPAAAAAATDDGLRASQAEARERLVRSDLDAVLAACDANEVKTEDLAEVYNRIRARATAAAAAK